MGNVENHKNKKPKILILLQMKSIAMENGKYCYAIMLFEIDCWFKTPPLLKMHSI